MNLRGVQGKSQPSLTQDNGPWVTVQNSSFPTILLCCLGHKGAVGQRRHDFNLLAVLHSIGERLSLKSGQYPLDHHGTPWVLRLLPGSPAPN